MMMIPTIILTTITSYFFSTFVTNISLSYWNSLPSLSSLSLSSLDNDDNDNDDVLLFHRAYFEYDTKYTQLDNSIWTYGTDYVLGLIMFVCSSRIRCVSIDTVDSRSRTKSNNRMIQTMMLVTSLNGNLRRLLHCYGVSVVAGGLAHQNFYSVEEMNSWSFRLLWTLCVGTVTFGTHDICSFIYHVIYLYLLYIMSFSINYVMLYYVFVHKMCCVVCC